MSSFTIFSIASATRRALSRSGSAIISPSTVGTICQRHAVAVLQPAALLGRAALEQRVPVAVDLGLVVAVHDERDRVVERVERPGADRHERLAEQRELDDLDRAGRAARRVGRQRRHAVDARVGEDRGVELRGLLGLLRVPEVGRDLLDRASRSLLQLPAGVEHHLEAAEDHPLAVERHVVASSSCAGRPSSSRCPRRGPPSTATRSTRTRRSRRASAFTAPLKSVTLPSGTSSPQHSTTRVAPYSLKIGAAFAAISR